MRLLGETMMTHQRTSSVRVMPEGKVDLEAVGGSWRQLEI